MLPSKAPSPLPQVSFPAEHRLTATAGAGGLVLWKIKLTEVASGTYPNTCKTFVNSEPVLFPPRPSQKDYIILERSFLPPEDPLAISHTLSTPGQSRSESLANNRPSSAEEENFDVNRQQDSPSFQSNSSSLSSSRRQFKYEHDQDGFISHAGLVRLQFDEARWEDKKDKLEAENIAFFSFLTAQALHPSAMSLLKADKRWKNIQRDFNLFEFCVLLNELIVSSPGIKSIDSLVKALSLRQGNKSNADYYLALDRTMQDVLADFQSDEHPGCICSKKLTSGLLIVGTNFRDYVINFLVSQPHFSLKNPDMIKMEISTYSKNQQVGQSYAKAAGGGSTVSDLLNKDSLSPAESKLLHTKLHSLLNTSEPPSTRSGTGMPKRDYNLMKPNWPHSLPQGPGNAPLENPEDASCDHCKSAGWNVSNHTTPQCHDVKIWNEKYGSKSGGDKSKNSKSKNPSTATKATPANAASQQAAANSLLNTIDDISALNLYEATAKAGSVIDTCENAN